MNASGLIASLERFGETLPKVVAGVSSSDARWKPQGGAWSILEVVRHLLDEEVEDFRKRVMLTLARPEWDWPRIDPEGWALERKYNEASLDDAAAKFAAERASSVKWLRSASPEADWSQAHKHPQIGPIRAGDLLTSWAAHDALHLRQIAKRMFQIAERDGEGFSSRYAGEWTA
jgi:hypothetical protein